jgi:MoxR-like ATPase
MSAGTVPEVNKVITVDKLFSARELVNEIYMDSRVEDYIVNLVFATREPENAGLADIKELIAFGASPRATLFLTRAARAHAFLRGRGYVTPEDIKSVGMDILRHRVIVTYEAEAENITPEQIVQKIFDSVEVP